jgi:hypothetical protein
MTDLPVAFRDLLAQHFTLPRLALEAQQASKDGTRKFLFRMADGQAIETVAIPDEDRMTFCISSQAGCALQCAFCATGAMGFARNLDVHEIAGQVRELALLDPPVRATNIVFMGMGEPLMNWKAVDRVLTILNDAKGFGIGARHVTVSTVGWLPGIVELGKRKEQFRLALSIHAPERRAPAAAHAGEHEVPARRGDRRGRRVRPARDVRVRDARRGERFTDPRRPARGARASVQGLREPHPAASRRVDGLHAHERPRRSPSSRGASAAPASRSRSARAAGSTSPRPAASYGSSGCGGGRQRVPSTIVRST